eukprot:32955-Amphidinium_carterae.2
MGKHFSSSDGACSHVVLCKVRMIRPRPLIMTVMLAASTSYAIPIGYATNLMVMGPGGYTFIDFLK